MTLKHFKISEFACKCGCGQNLIDYTFVAEVDRLRQELGFPLVVTSGYRCPEHNNRVSGTGKTGPHTTGHAADFRVRGAEAYRVVKSAMHRGFTGIGVQQKGDVRFIHLDNLTNKVGSPRPTIWSY